MYHVETGPKGSHIQPLGIQYVISCKNAPHGINLAYVTLQEMVVVSR